MKILLIETSTERGVVAYSDAAHTCVQIEFPFGIAQSRFLIPTLAELLEVHPELVDVVAVGIGPGSYTGIRLGVSVAQALAYSWRVPVVGVCTLDGFVPAVASAPFAAIVDARMGGLYCLRSDKSQPERVSLSQAEHYLEGISHLVTPYAAKVQERLQDKCERRWTWEERAPSAEALFAKARDNLEKNLHVARPPQHLELMYADTC